MVFAIVYSIAFLIGVIFGALTIAVIKNNDQECFGCFFFMMAVILGETIILVGLLVFDFHLFLEGPIDIYFSGGGWIVMGYILGAVTFGLYDQNKCPFTVVIFFGIAMILFSSAIPDTIFSLILFPTMSSLSGLSFYTIIGLFMLLIVGISAYFFRNYRLTSIAVMMFSLQMIVIVLLGVLSNTFSLMTAVVTILSVTRFSGLLYKKGIGGITYEERWQIITLVAIFTPAAVVLYFSPFDMILSLVLLLPPLIIGILSLVVGIGTLVLIIWGFGFVTFEERVSEHRIRKAEKEAIEYYKRKEKERQTAVKPSSDQKPISRIQDKFDESSAREYVRSLLWRTQREFPLLDSMSSDSDLFWATYERLHEDLIEAEQVVDLFGLSELRANVKDVMMKLEGRTGS